MKKPNRCFGNQLDERLRIVCKLCDIAAAHFWRAQRHSKGKCKRANGGALLKLMCLRWWWWWWWLATMAFGTIYMPLYVYIYICICNYVAHNSVHFYLPLLLLLLMLFWMWPYSWRRMRFTAPLTLSLLRLNEYAKVLTSGPVPTPSTSSALPHSPS